MQKYWKFPMLDFNKMYIMIYVTHIQNYAKPGFIKDRYA
jgi:hypothetical protein